MPLTLLHISDIHFHSPSAGWDEDADLRNELLRDVRATLNQGQNFDAVVIGGDIAFSATEEEYSIASDWIDELLKAAGGLVPGQVRVVPGNHDISRDAVRQSTHALQFRLALARSTVAGVDQVLRDQVALDPMAQELLGPLAEYNSFAARFGCPTSAEKLAWEDDSMVVDGHAVRLVGINSVINSGPADGLGDLVVGKHQCRVLRDSSSIRILMLHHPPPWIKDWTEIEGHVRRTHLILFGHEHAFEARQPIPMGTVEVSAGALAPERDAHGERDPYLPTYNVITLSVSNPSQVNLEIKTRKWNLAMTRFELAEESEFSVAMEPQVDFEHAPPTDEQESVSDASPLVLLPVEEGVVVTEQEAERRADLRNVGVRFAQLPAAKRWHLAESIGVGDPGDTQLIASDRNIAVLQRIRDRGLVNQLVEEMDR